MKDGESDGFRMMLGTQEVTLIDHVMFYMVQLTKPCELGLTAGISLKMRQQRHGEFGRHVPDHMVSRQRSEI